MMNTRFRILFLASWYPNEDHPISGIFIKRHAEAVSKYCDVAVLYVHQSQHRTSTKVEYSIEDGIKTVRVYSRKTPFKNRLLKIFYNMMFNNYIINSYKGLKIIRKEFGGIDIIHVNVALPSGWVAFLLNLRFKIPFVITEHFTSVSREKDGKISLRYHTGWINNFFLKYLFNKAKKVILPINEFKQRLIDHGFVGNYQIIPNVIDKTRYRPLNNCNTNNISSNIKKLLHVSLLVEEERKNVSDILRACKILSQKRQDFSLNIVGGGYDRLMLEKLAEELNIKNRFVFFLGRLSDEELTRIMSASDFFVLNSYQENFSVVCAEALSSGIPVISTRCGGPEDYITEDVGILIEPGNIEELVKGMDYMIDNHWRYDPQKLHEYAEKRFSYEVVGRQIYDIYGETLKEWTVGFGKSKVEIEPNWLVVDIGSGHNPHRRADVLVDREIEKTPDRSGEKAKIPKDKPFIIADGCNLPFKNNSFDFAIVSHVAEHVDGPEQFCKELMRVAKRGYIETPGILTDIMLNETVHKWRVFTKKGILKFRMKNNFKSLSETFYRIFYYEDNRNEHIPLVIKKKSLVFLIKGVKYLLNRIWKHLPYTYTYYMWNRKIEFKVIKT